MKVMVTGGAGFIGSEFVRQALKKGLKVIVVDKLTYAGDMKRLEEVRDQIGFYQVDIVNRGALREVFETERPEVVVHFAAESHVDRSILDSTPFIDTNVKGTQNLLDLSKEYGVERFINISTDEVYGELGEEGEFYETTPLNPNSPYSVSKASADMLGRAYWRTFKLPVITVRPSNNYGPWQYPEKLIPVVILKAYKNEKVPVYGRGLNVREWLYVEDCAKAILMIMERGKDGEIYNVGSGERKRNIQVVKRILSIMGRGEDLIEFVPDRPGHDFRYALNADKVRREIGWKPSTSFDDGIELTVKWYLEHMDWVLNKLEELKAFWEKEHWKKKEEALTKR